MTRSESTPEAIIGKAKQLDAYGRAWADSLPDWVVTVCPDWYVGAAGMRDVESWDKARVKAIKQIQDGGFTWVTREDGSKERFVPSPMTHARMVTLVERGNMFLVMAAAPLLVADSRAKGKDGSTLAGRVKAMGGIQAYSEDKNNSPVYEVIMAAYALDRAQVSYDKAYAALLEAPLDEKRATRRDRAQVALDAASTRFDAAWLAIHAVKEEPAASIVETSVDQVSADAAAVVA